MQKLKKKFNKNLIKKTILVLILYPLAFIINFPLLWMLISSFKTSLELFEIPPTILPHSITFEHYFELVKVTKFLLQYRNSIFVAICASLLTLFFSSLASYSISRFKFKFSTLFSTVTLLFYMLPSILLVIPLFIIFGKIGLGNNLLSLIIVYLTFNLPFGILLMRSYYAGVPAELEEAAMIDGCTRFQAFYRVVIPAVLPGIISTFIFSFIMAWSEYLFAATFIQSDSLKTLPVGISLLMDQSGAYSWGVVNASGVLIMVPVLIIFIIIQKQLIAGFTVGAIKG